MVGGKSLPVSLSGVQKFDLASSAVEVMNRRNIVMLVGLSAGRAV